MNLLQNHLLPAGILALVSLLFSACSADSATATPARTIQVTLMPTVTRDIPPSAVPTAASVPPVVPVASPAPLAEPTPGAINSPDGQLSCSGVGLYRQCNDSVLRISFDMPFAWGAVTTTYKSYSDGFNTGNETKYKFGAVLAPNGDLLKIEAGGTSKIFVLARDGDNTSFNGFAAMPVDCVSNTEIIYRCIKVNDRVILQLSIANHMWLCSLGPQPPLKPLAAIYIDLPDNPKINGFVALADISTAALAKALRDILREPDESGSPAGCKIDAIWQTYDAEATAFLQSLEEGTADVDDQTLFGQVKHVAESIRPLSVP